MNRYHHAMMFACLAVMGGAMLLIWRAPSPGNGAWLLLPMALCLGAHLLLHRHGHHGDSRDESSHRRH
ncbi:hypothetical protein [Halomonas salifodinae]|uniref:hypothetical protein n=1 Tax=Halomonas salifodinae TaxID=438745 RepID=UPI0033B03CF4